MPRDDDMEDLFGRYDPPMGDGDDYPMDLQVDGRRSLSLQEFCRQAKDLLDANETTDFIRFVLTGKGADGSQACIDPVINRVTQDHPLEILRDYDSLLGISKTIQVSCDITVYPASRREDTLSKNVHLRHDFKTSNGTFAEDLHRVPNICIGKWGVHNMIRAFIPGLYDGQTRTPFLTQDEQTLFYEQGLLSAVKELCQDRSDEWPASYPDEMFRARGHNGTLSFQSKMIPSWNVKDLGSKIRSNLRAAEIPWGTGIVFLHQIRGVKDTSHHSVNRDAADLALEEFLAKESLDPGMVGSWWIDVGLQATSRGTWIDKDSLAWRTDSHGSIVQEIFGHTENEAARLSSIGSSHYTRDMTSHLPQVSGCRISPGVQGKGRYEVAYCQLYTTDKAVTYRPEGGHYGKYITCEDAIKGKADHFMQGLYDLYSNAINQNHAQARMELRVPMRYATEVLLELDEDVIRQGLVSFPSVEWWSLRAYRAKAAQLLFRWQSEASWELRATMPALLLTAGLVWLVNGLHSAPDNKPASRKLMDCILPEVERDGANEMFLAYGRAADEDEDGNFRDENFEVRLTLPGIPYGLVFFHSLRLGERHPAPRLGHGKALAPRSFRFLFGVDFEDVDEGFFRSTRGRRAVAPLRSNNRTQRTKRYVRDDDGSPERLFHLRVGGVGLEARARDDGSDSEEAGGEEVQDVDKVLTDLWHQFIQDVSQKVANRRGADEEGYCKISSANRAESGERLYKNLRLSDFFNDCQYMVGNENDWDAVFDHMFPLSGKVAKTQNYKSSLYYGKWEVIRDRAVDKKSREAIRKALKSRFSKLLWFPCAQSDRIWPTRFYKRFTKFINHGEPAPWVICRREPRWEL